MRSLIALIRMRGESWSRASCIVPAAWRIVPSALRSAARRDRPGGDVVHAAVKLRYAGRMLGIQSHVGGRWLVMLGCAGNVHEELRAGWRLLRITWPFVAIVLVLVVLAQRKPRDRLGDPGVRRWRKPLVKGAERSGRQPAPLRAIALGSGLPGTARRRRCGRNGRPALRAHEQRAWPGARARVAHRQGSGPSGAGESDGRAAARGAYREARRRHDSRAPRRRRARGRRVGRSNPGSHGPDRRRGAGAEGRHPRATAGRTAVASGAARRAHRTRQPAGVRAATGSRARKRVRRSDEGTRFSISTSIISRRSTTPAGTPPATSCCARSAKCFSASCANAIRSPGWAATSLPSCWRTARRTTRRESRNRCGRKWPTVEFALGRSGGFVSVSASASCRSPTSVIRWRMSCALRTRAATQAKNAGRDRVRVHDARGRRRARPRRTFRPALPR